MRYLRLAAVNLAVLAAVAGPALVWRGGILESEALSFITHYTAPRPLLQKLFDPNLNDFGAYQARELSYFFDYLDAEFYLWTLRTSGEPSFISLSALLSSALMAALLVVGIRRTMRSVDPITTALVTACLVTSFPFVATMGVYYRSSKPLLAVTLLGLLFQVRHVLQQRALGAESASQLRARILTGGLCVAAGLLDRQGAFYVLLACALLGLHYRFTRQLGDLFAVTGLAAVFLLVYDLAVAPALVRGLNGYWPDMAYQSKAVRSWSLLWHPRPFWQSLQLLVENAGVVAGGFRLGGLVLLAVAVALTVGARGWGSANRYVALAFAGQVVMFALMIRQHPPIHDYADHRYWYYPLPYAGTVAFTGALWLNALWPRSSGRTRIIAQGILLLMIASNLADVNRYRDLLKTGPWFASVYAQSELLKSSFRIGVPEPGLDAESREFFDYSRGIP